MNHEELAKLKKKLVVFFLLLFAAVGKPDAVKAAAAEKIELDQTYTVQLASDWSAPLYRFDVPVAGNISIQVKNTDPVGTRQIGIQLFDADNSALTDVWGGTNVELPVYPTDGNRTFYIKLSDYINTYDATFYLTVNFQPATDWETEGNNTTGSADLITPGKKWYGLLHDTDPCDYFKFKVNGSKKVAITFGPKEVSGGDNRWNVYLINSSNQSRAICEWSSTTQTHTCYLKKGTYYLKIENANAGNNVIYALSYTESALKLAKPAITSMRLTGNSGWPPYVELSNIKIKNSGDAAGYTVRVAKKKSMKGEIAEEDIDFSQQNTKKQVSLGARLAVIKTYYVQARSYVTDPFGVKIYGKYGAVKDKSLSSTVYNGLKK